MDKLIEFFITNVGTDKIWIGFLFFAIYYVVQKEPFKIFTHFSEKKEKEHELAKSLLEMEKLGKEANEFLKEHLERIAFQKYYGINADADMRTALIKFQKKHQRKIGWHHLRRAYQNVSLEGSTLVAKLGWGDHVLRWLVTAMCWPIGSYAVTVIFFAILNGTQNKLRFFELTFAALLLLAATMLFSSMNWPYHSTRKIIAIIKDGN